MAIPKAAPFEAILATVHLLEAQPARGASRRLPFAGAIDERGRIIGERSLWLACGEEGEIGLEALVRRVAKELAGAGHVTPDAAAAFALAFAFLVPAPPGGAVDRLNALLSRIKRVDVTLLTWFGLPMPERYAIDIPPFYFGPTRTEKLKYRCERAGSDYYARYASSIKGTCSIERAPRSVVLLDVEFAQTEIVGDAVLFAPPGLRPIVESILNGYFSLMNGALFEEFLPEFVACQDVIVSLGAPFIDPQSLFKVFGFQQVAIFASLGKHGFVAPRGPGPLQLELANAHVRVPESLRELEGRFSYDGGRSTPLHNTLHLYCSFVARARRHASAGRHDEALLHLVIAVEMVFGERERIQSSVAERVSVLTHAAVGRSFAEQRKWVEGVYETRSKYVHAGRSELRDGQLDSLFRTCALLTRRILRAAQTSGESGDALASWLAEVDYLAKAMAASKTPGDDDLAAAFLMSEDDTPYEGARG